MKKIAVAALCAMCWVGPFRAHANDTGLCAASFCGDIDNSGFTTAVDALATLRLAVGLDDAAPVCDATFCRGNHCTTEQLAVSTFYDDTTADVTCYSGQEE